MKIKKKLFTQKILDNTYNGTVHQYCMFSGGSTSGMMAALIAMMPDFRPERWTFVFANTGREMPETMDFICRVNEKFLDGKLVCLEYMESNVYKTVPLELCNMDGLPFESYLKDYGFRPSYQYDSCDEYLKFEAYEWLSRKMMLTNRGRTGTLRYNLGYRFDEPWLYRYVIPRNDEILANPKNFGRLDCVPLMLAGIVAKDVDEFWKKQGFKLELERWKGNCDFCPWKGVRDTVQMIREHPDRIQWWLDMAEKYPVEFGADQFFGGYDYRDLKKMADNNAYIDGSAKHGQAYAHARTWEKKGVVWDSKSKQWLDRDTKTPLLFLS